jgi:flagellar biosynthesis/type III secretory pathway protein FliH
MTEITDQTSGHYYDSMQDALALVDPSVKQAVKKKINEAIELHAQAVRRDAYDKGWEDGYQEGRAEGESTTLDYLK